MTLTEKQTVNLDVVKGIIPKRVPISAKVPLEACAEYAGLNVAETQWTLNGVDKAYGVMAELVDSDTIAVGGEEKNPALFRILGSKGYTMTSTGSYQHYDVITLYEEEYPELIAKPMDFILEKVMPRMFPALDAPPMQAAMVLAQAYAANFEHNAKLGRIKAPLMAKYGYYAPPADSCSITRAPFDLISDFLRGFTGISVDIRRRPEMLKDAVHAVLPFQILRGTPGNICSEGFTFMPLHFATYMKEKDFAKLYWPDLEAFVHILGKKGQACQLFCEGDWMRYIDYLQDLPAGTRFKFEYGDAKLIKDKVGKDHIITGLYPLTYLKSATKQECEDKAKELTDILAPGGGYIFGYDKDALSLGSMNLDNFIAVVDYVKNNCTYSNAGDIASEKISQPKEYKDFECEEISSQYHKMTSSDPELDTYFCDTVEEKLLAHEKNILAMLCRSL